MGGEALDGCPGDKIQMLEAGAFVGEAVPCNPLPRCSMPFVSADPPF